MAYTREDLDTQINSDETLSQYIINSTLHFYNEVATREELDVLSDEEVNDLVEHFDMLWDK